MASKPRLKMTLCGIVSFLAAPAPAVEQPGMAELLRRLHLSGYSSNLRAPEFSGITVDDRSVSLTALRGRVIILTFWASWCQECRPQMPAFERLHREFAAQGLSVVGINAREGATSVRAYGKELGLTFPLVLDSRGDINVAYGVIGLPTTFLIGRNGRPVALAIGPREWNGNTARTLIAALLAAPPSSKEIR